MDSKHAIYHRKNKVSKSVLNKAKLENTLNSNHCLCTKPIKVHERFIIFPKKVKLAWYGVRLQHLLNFSVTDILKVEEDALHKDWTMVKWW